EKVKTGLFSSERVTTGFRYSIGLMMSLVRGPVDLLVNIRNDESFAWGEDAPSADANVVPTDAGAAYNIDEPGFFGGEESGGGGGLIGGGRIFIGSETQATSAYLAQFQTPTPAYRGTCFITWERGEIGLGPTIRPFEFELQRIPDGLDLATLQPGDEEVNLGTNPMNVIFEALVNDEWGLNVGSGNVNVIGLRAIAATLKTEGNGFAWVWDRQLNVLEVIRMIEEQVDGVLFTDPVSNNYDFKLVRFDYTPGTLPLLDETNVTEVSRFQRPAWAETSNHVTAQFTDRRKNYTESFALAQDMANVEIVQAVNAAAIKFPGVKDPTLANGLVWRELRQLSFPGATGQLTADRSQWDLTPGDVRELTWGRLGLTRLPVRIVKVNRGQILNNKIKIDWTQDIFSINAGTFSDPIDTGWIPVPSVAQPSLRERLWEVPFQLSLDNERHLAVVCSRDGGLHISFDVMADRSGGTAFAFEGTEADFTPTGLLAGAVFRDLDGPPHYLQDIEVDGLNDVTFDELLAAGDTTVDPNNPANIFLVDEELFFYESATDLGGGLIRLVNCHRGTFDTIPADHADNAVV
ncbi:MAG: phage tail protein, partial [Gemmatimonadota bacterium]